MVGIGSMSSSTLRRIDFPPFTAIRRPQKTNLPHGSFPLLSGQSQAAMPCSSGEIAEIQFARLFMCPESKMFLGKITDPYYKQDGKHLA